MDILSGTTLYQRFLDSRNNALNQQLNQEFVVSNEKKPIKKTIKYKGNGKKFSESVKDYLDIHNIKNKTQFEYHGLWNPLYRYVEINSREHWEHLKKNTTLSHLKSNIRFYAQKRIEGYSSYEPAS